MSESERNGAGSSGVERYVSRKDAARALDVHEKTVEKWGRDGAFRVVAQQGDRGKVRIGADSNGVPLFNEGWSREGRTEPGASDRPEARRIAVEDVRLVARELPAMIAALPPIPDPAKEALERGEPESVVAARVEARGRVVQALIFALGFFAAGFLALAVFCVTTGKRLRFK